MSLRGLSQSTATFFLTAYLKLVVLHSTPDTLRAMDKKQKKQYPQGKSEQHLIGFFEFVLSLVKECFNSTSLV